MQFSLERWRLLPVCTILYLFTIFSFPVHLSAVVNADGSFGHVIPIQVPPGRMGLEPKLSLMYNSNIGNGMLGMGWQLAGLSQISRDISYGINYNGNDHYIHSDLGRLVYSGHDAQYCTQKESFTQVTKSGSCGDGPCSWTIIDKSGVKYEFGHSTDSRVSAIGKNGSIRIWALNKITDVHGNYLEITYTTDSGAYYPQKITYTMGNGISVTHSLEFKYKTRSDHSVKHTDNASVDMKKRLQAIEVNSDGDLVRKYQLTYEYSPNTNRSRMVSVQEFDKDETPLPAQTFTWQDGQTISYTHTNQNFGDGDGIWNKGTVFAGDVDGDGKTDLIFAFYDNGLRIRTKSIDAPALDILSSINNGRGRITTIEYEYNTKLANAIKPTLSGYPKVASSYPTSLVTRVSSRDAQGTSFSKSYAYYNGQYYSGYLPNRVSLGFEWIKETNDQTGEKVQTYYHHTDKTLNEQRALAGQIKQKETFVGNGNKVSVETYQYQVSHPKTGIDLVKLTQVITKKYTDNNVLFVTNTKSLTYDEYGNVTQSAEVQGSQNTTTDITYSYDTTNWIVDRATELPKTVIYW